MYIIKKEINTSSLSFVTEIPCVEDELEDRRVLVIRCRNNYTGPQPRYVPYHQTYFKDADLRLCNCGAKRTP